MQIFYHSVPFIIEFFSQSTLNILTNKGKHHYAPTNITPFSVTVFKHLVPHLLITLVRKNILAISKTVNLQVISLSPSKTSVSTEMGGSLGTGMQNV